MGRASTVSVSAPITETKKRKQAEKERNAQRDDIRDVERNDNRNGVRNDQTESNVTGDNTNTNSNNLNTKEQQRVREDSGTQDFIKTENQDRLSPAPREFSIHRHGKPPLRLDLANLGDVFARTLDRYLKGNSDSLLMHDKMMKIPEDFVAYILVSFLSYLNLHQSDIAAGHIGRKFSWWINSNFDSLEKEFENVGKDLAWFNRELENTNGLCPDPEGS